MNGIAGFIDFMVNVAGSLAILTVIAIVGLVAFGGF